MPEVAQEGNVVINPGWEQFKRYTFSPAVLRGQLLVMSGMTATDDNGEIVGKGDIVAQTRYIFEKIKAILDAAHAKPSDIIKTTDFMVTLENYNATSEVRREFFGDSFPASTGVVVKRLIRPDALIEIEAMAVVPESTR